jgi:hypothetical protein
MRIVAAIRVALALVLACDIPLMVRSAVLLTTGGVHAVHSWVVHLALMGRVFDVGLAEQDRLIVRAYLLFALMIFVFPAMLYVLQRRVALRVAARRSRGPTASGHSFR